MNTEPRTKKAAACMRNLFFPICALAISSAAVGQRDLTSWQNLGTLQRGEKIQIRESNSKKVSGSFLSVSATAILVQKGDGSESIAKENVRSVKRMQNKHRLRNTVIVAAAGAGVGAGIGAATFHPCPHSQTFCLQIGGRSLPAGIGAVAGLLGGAAIGALIPEHDTIYSLSP